MNYYLFIYNIISVIDNCLSSPCLNGATCTNRINAFNCSCVAGYNGMYCQKGL